MSINHLSTFDDVFVEAQKLNLYQKLVQQLNKDLLYANINLQFDDQVLSSSLKLALHEVVYKLIQEKFTDYLNLLYIIDVSEKQIKQLDGSDILTLSEDVTFLILKREWQKVWLRHSYK